MRRPYAPVLKGPGGSDVRRVGPGSPSHAPRDRPALSHPGDAALSAHERALRMLEARSYGAVELARRLVRKGHPPDEVEASLERLTAAGLLNDAAFARQLTRSRVLDRGMAGRRVRLELIARGIRPAVATQAVAEVLGDEEVDEAAAAARLARRRSQQLAGLAPATLRRRLYAYLARRGYEADAVRRAVDAVMAGGPPPPGRNSSPRIQNR